MPTKDTHCFLSPGLHTTGQATVSLTRRPGSVRVVLTRSDRRQTLPRLAMDDEAPHATYRHRASGLAPFQIVGALEGRWVVLRRQRSAPFCVTRQHLARDYERLP